MNKKKILIITLIAVLLLGAAGGYIYYDYTSRVYTKALVEAGSAVTAQDFQKRASAEVAVLSFDGTEGAEISTELPGEHAVVLKSWIYTYRGTLIVQDTTAPQVEVEKMEIRSGETVTAEDFLVSVTDNTETTVSFAEEPDFEVYGTQTVIIRVTDLGGNITNSETTLTIDPLNDIINVEAGTEIPDASEFLLPGVEGVEVSYVSGLEEVRLNHVNEYPVTLEANGEEYPVIINVCDSHAPVMETTDVEAFLTSEITPEMFVVSCEDATDVWFTFEQDPDLTLEGTQSLKLFAVDEGGTTDSAEVHLTLKADTEAPVLYGVKDQTVYVGSTVSYRKGVSAVDNCDGDVEFSVNTDGVQLSEVGDYTVTYSAKDRAGNEAVKTITIHVINKDYSDETVNELADGVLSTIITDGMSDMDKLSAIYTWVRNHVTYINHSDKNSFNQGAYEGLHDHKGDCFVYAATSDALLRRAGITTMIITKIPTRTSHYWNLVDIGEGWHHFDTTPRRGGFECLYKTDAELMEYSNIHHGSHNYDRTVYTNIQ
jgi:hypothetical protein